MPERLLFLFSAPRSGSTFLRGALGAHPDITLTNESGWVAALRKAELLTCTPSMQAIDDGEGFTTVGLIPHAYLGAHAAAFRAAAQEYVAAFARSIGATTRYFGDKIHSHNDAAFLVRAFPATTLVYLVRDLRDVLVSSYTFQEKQATAWQGADFTTRCDHLARLTHQMHAMHQDRGGPLVRYEQLVEDPATELRTILAALGLPPSREVDRWLAEDAKTLFASHGTSDDPRASIGRWRHMLDDRQLAEVETRLTPALAAFGYA
jgi:hypothetical protein